MFLSKALDKPLIVWSFASSVGVSSNSRSALVVSGPMEASLSSGLLLHILTIFSAPSHMNDIDLMEKMDLPAFKIGSDLACHIPLLKRVAKFQKPIILSTGMCSMDEVKKSVNTIFKKNLRLFFAELV